MLLFNSCRPGRVRGRRGGLPEGFGMRRCGIFAASVRNSGCVITEFRLRYSGISGLCGGDGWDTRQAQQGGWPVVPVAHSHVRGSVVAVRHVGVGLLGGVYLHVVDHDVGGAGDDEFEHVGHVVGAQGLQPAVDGFGLVRVAVVAHEG